jgi:hypothetical protein
LFPMFLFVPAQNCLRSLKLLIRFGVPDGTVLNRIATVRERLYACCAVFEGEGLEPTAHAPTFHGAR